MKKIIRKHAILGLVLIITMSLLVSSCGLFGGSKAAEEIELSVDRYFRSIESGRLARDDYESEYSDDAPFASLVFEEDVASALMVDGMSRISFEIGEIDADPRNKEGSCVVLLTAIDLETIIDELGDSYSEEEWVELFESEDAPVSEHEVLIYLFYDDDEELWIIEDTSEVADVLGKPYTQIMFSSSGSQDISDAFLRALSASDFSQISDISDGIFVRSDFVDDEYDIAIHLFDLVFGDMQYEMTYEYFEDDGDYVEYNYLLTVPDYETPFFEMGMDESLMAELTQEVFYGFTLIDSELYLEDAYKDYIEVSNSMLYDIISDSSDTLEMDVVIAVEYDDFLEEWIVTWCSYELLIFSDLMYNYDPMDYIGIDAQGRIAQVVYDNLFDSGRIDQFGYYRGLSIFVDDVDFEMDSGEYDEEEVIGLIDEILWYDYYLEDYVDSYDADTFLLNVDVYFDELVPGLYLQCDFYADDGQTLLGTDDDFMDDMYYYAEFIFVNDDERPLEPGTYSAVIYMDDGSVIAETSIELG